MRRWKDWHVLRHVNIRKPRGEKMHSSDFTDSTEIKMPTGTREVPTDSSTSEISCHFRIKVLL